MQLKKCLISLAKIWQTVVLYIHKKYASLLFVSDIQLLKWFSWKLVKNKLANKFDVCTYILF